MGWKVYFWIMVVVLVTSHLIVFSSGARIHNYLDVPISLITVAGIYAYAYKIKLINQYIWKIWLVFAIVWEILLSILLTTIDTKYEVGFYVDLIAALISLALILPGYIALYIYAFRSDDIWQQNNFL